MSTVGEIERDAMTTIFDLLQRLWDRYGSEFLRGVVVVISPDLKPEIDVHFKQARWYTTAGDPSSWEVMFRMDDAAPYVEMLTDFGKVHMQIHKDAPPRTVEIWRENMDKRDGPLAAATRISL